MELDAMFDAVQDKINAFEGDALDHERKAACLAHLATVRMHAAELEATATPPAAATPAAVTEP